MIGIDMSAVEHAGNRYNKGAVLWDSYTNTATC